MSMHHTHQTTAANRGCNVENHKYDLKPRVHVDLVALLNYQRPFTMTPTFILGFLGAAVVLQIIRLAVNSWQHARRARSLGCGSLPRLPCKDPIGISTLKESMAADKSKTIPQLSERRFKQMSEQEGRFVTTFIMRNLGRDVTFTVDPKNVQAVLATQFKDFELGAPRRRNLHPLLGTGIVSAIWLNQCSLAKS